MLCIWLYLRHSKNKLVISNHEEEFICSGIIYNQMKEVIEENLQNQRNTNSLEKS